MLTVKHISLSGEETIVQSETVFYSSHKSQPTSATAPRMSPTVHADGQEFVGGTVFVMNSNGKTVARYDLGASNVPQGVDVDGVNCTAKMLAA